MAKNFTLSPKYIARLQQRAAVRDDGNCSRAIERAIDEADGNAQAMRHDVRGALNSILLQCVEVRHWTRQPGALEAVSKIETSVADIVKRLQQAA